MPFQDVDDEQAIVVPKAPGSVERLLRRVFVEDLGLKLLALLITLVMWFAVTGENKPVTMGSAVQLNFILPPNLAVSNDPPKTVEVYLTGRKSKLDVIRASDLVATVNLGDSSAGERVIRLSSDRVSIQLPEGVKLESFKPNAISTRLEPRTERQIPVGVRLDGKPAEGFEVYGVQAAPGTIKVHGPESHVTQLQNVPTETISVSGRKDTFTMSNVAIDISDQKVEALSLDVDVTIEIGEKRIDKLFEHVTVQSGDGTDHKPATATVILKGPPKVLNQLRSEEIKLVFNKDATGSNSVRVELPQGIDQQVKVVSTSLP